MQEPKHRDPADWNENSHTPDLAAAVDSIEDLLAEQAAEHWRRVGVPKNSKQLIIRTVNFALNVGKSSTGNTHSLEAQEMAARILATVIDSGHDALMVAKCIDFAIGMNVQGPITEQDIANQHSLTRAAISKRCIQICDEFGVPPSAGMRSLPTRRRYGLRQRGRRAVQNRDAWSFSSLLKSAIHDDSRGSHSKPGARQDGRGRTGRRDSTGSRRQAHKALH